MKADIPAEVPFAYEVISRLAPRLGINLELEPFGMEAARLQFANGRVAHFRHGNLDINGSGSADIARDKYSCAYFLAQAGIPVPPSYPVRRETAEQICEQDRIRSFAAEHGWPLLVKPNSLYGGRGVEKIDNLSALRHAVAAALRLDKLALIQPFLAGHDVRVVVFDGTLIAAYGRIPPTLIGDGIRPIRQLIADFYTRYDLSTLTNRLPDRRDPEDRLARRAGGLDRVPASGEPLPLVDAANFATGADVVDLTRTAPPGMLALAVHAASVSGLRLAGVDLLVNSALPCTGLLSANEPRGTRPETSELVSNGVVLEINGAPELDGIAALGDQHAASVDQIYETILQELMHQTRRTVI